MISYNLSRAISNHPARIATFTLCRLGMSHFSVSLNDLLRRNKVWAQQHEKDNPGFFNDTSDRQEPLALIIGCVDARLDPLRAFGSELNRFLICRNVANIVNVGDHSVDSSIQLAVNNYHISTILVTGHSNCGGVKLALEPSEDTTSLSDWVSPIREIIKQEKRENFTEEEFGRHITEQNVKRSVYNISKNKHVVKARLSRTILICGMIYNVSSGLIDVVDTNMGLNEDNDNDKLDAKN